MQTEPVFKQIHIIGGGTVFYIRNHFAICAPAYGNTAKHIFELCRKHSTLEANLHLTKMASNGDGDLDTNEDVSKRIDEIVADKLTKIVFMTAALCDYEGYITHNAVPTDSGKYEERLHSKDKPQVLMTMLPGDKIIAKIRETRKDIFLVGFKTTCGASAKEQYIAGLGLCKDASCNLVLANDTKTRLNMVITPEEAKYHETTDRDEALTGLVDMALMRSHLTFTRSTVVAGQPVPWDSPEVPATLRKVVDYCIGSKAYKPFKGSTVGHFAAKISETEFLTSIRKSNFNDLAKLGLVRIKTDGPDSVLAYGAKPSVGGQSQRIVFHDHVDYDCIVHFHCPLREGHRDDIPIRSQREVECGSHECGKNTSSGLKKFGDLSCVMLDQHGPNIVFNRKTNPEAIIAFIEANFDLAAKTGGYIP